ncbi:cyclin N-terminal domain-containing protein 1-like [Lingula anatina]|uniref:Cyclin N-terminal domain-containing protein 1-like n=1 Tax=Lingula anatina TaxID=7574 RepID=A0A1S3K6D2_LINAN|nr:cyclin N-terminal domain-containing protein 1-like [Lingula anatina]|eukprot:XP_013417816.2 cyclin N-terminal domain-containing protein 1-like [Lingula anatina]
MTSKNAKNTTKRKHDGIFGTPPEPVFNASPSAMTPEMLEDWLRILVSQNEQRMLKANVAHGYFKSGDAVQFVFLTCEHFKLADEAKYIAVELFDSFMVRHITDLWCEVKEMKISKEEKKKRWKEIRVGVERQMVIRVVSCCQLASKLTSHYKIISPRRVKKFLQEFVNQRYSADSIMQSELRILKALEYKVMISSPLLYVETLLEVLGHTEPDLSVKVYHGVGLKVMDLVYIQRREIYDLLFLTALEQDTISETDRNKCISLEYDMFLLSSSVISAASYVVDQTNTDKVIDHLSQITKIPTSDILDFATVIVQHILQI